MSINNNVAYALLSKADDLLREAEKLVERDSEAYQAIGYAITAVSGAQSEILL